MNKKSSKNNAKLNKKIVWCCKQNKGIKLIESNDNLSKEYIKKAEDTLDAVKINKKIWKIITAYYACYNALYSILMKVGIKCEIHDCTIELMKLIKDFDEKDITFLKSLKKNRIQAQYYLEEKELESELEVKEFVLKCKCILDSLDTIDLKNKIKRCLND